MRGGKADRLGEQQQQELVVQESPAQQEQEHLASVFKTELDLIVQREQGQERIYWYVATSCVSVDLLFPFHLYLVLAALTFLLCVDSSIMRACL